MLRVNLICLNYTSGRCLRVSEAHWNIERECTMNLRNSRELLHRHPYLSGVQLIV